MFSCALHMDHERLPDDAVLASPHQGQRPRFALRLLIEGSVVVAMLGSLWWGMSILGAHVLASESAPPPIYVAGCPVGDTLEKNSRGGRGCSGAGASHPISSRQPGAGLGEDALGADKAKGR